MMKYKIDQRSNWTQNSNFIERRIEKDISKCLMNEYMLVFCATQFHSTSQGEKTKKINISIIES